MFNIFVVMNVHFSAL